MTIDASGFTDELPVFNYKEAILSAVDTNQVTIITAETGAGKSTQVPQYLVDHGYQKVIVTQPRILAARNLSKRVREEWAIRTGKDSDEIIGYRTAHERDDGPDTAILYCTDGLQLVREITGSGTSERQILVLDEVHEWNENMEVLVAWANKRCQEEPRFKVVIMSATIEVDTLAAYFKGAATIAVPGRSYEVVKRQGKNVVAEIIEKLDTSNSNMLVFLPGKAEIESVASMVKIKAAAAGVPIIPLHSQLEASAQQLAFASYPNGKIILTTNIAQTSVTIDDIDVVIDSGLARRSEVRNGVEGLFISQISQADCLQRAGRAGRTKSGEYILAPLDEMECLPFDERPEYATPEILRKHIDRLTLRLANVGMDIEELEFYHDPSKRAIKMAKQTLISLGAMTPSGEVTSVGRQMERFPVESSYARMLVEVSQYDDALQMKLAAIIGIQEVGGIVKGGTRYTGWRKYTKQTRSDLIAQYDVYLAFPQIDPETYEDVGIISKNVLKAEEVIQRLHRDLGLDGSALSPVASDEVERLLQCIVAGQINQLWMVEGDGTAIHLTTKKKRELSSSTVVTNPKLVAGTPFDLQIQTQRGDLETLHLVQGITEVNPKWLQALAPHLFSVRRGKTYFDSRRGALATRQLVRFNGRTIEGGGEPVTQSNTRDKRLFSELYGTWVYERLESERRHLQQGYHRRIPMIPLRQIQQKVRSIVGNAMSLDELSDYQREDLTKLGKMETYLGDVFVAKIKSLRQKKDDRHGADYGRSSWKPQHKRKYDRRKGR
ncbi:MAG TPA: helicase-related protein [Candidatus Saccharimonadales bacterium]|jgi:HrpA-like RNA helicase|nr:helicase-related protein [Candidatus Saccharimonadales bacterium]